ncbi:MAG: hypothetical protein FJ252_04735 [Phycisphaerae bacterium]|nr:hypothetical protein [Phycisphaerae bacterium]
MTPNDDHPDRPGAHERLVHGLLGALAADHAAQQDRRVRAAIACIDRRDGALARVGRFGVARFAAAGALAAMLSIAVVLSIGPATNSAHATLQSISNRLATGNRSYRQTIVVGNRDGTESLREAMVDVGTGRRFVFAIDIDALPIGPRMSGAHGRPLMPGVRDRRAPDHDDRPGKVDPGQARPDGLRRMPDGSGFGDRHGAPPIAWGFDGDEYWQVDLDGVVTRSSDPLRMRDPMLLLAGPASDQDGEGNDDELLTLQPLLDRLETGFDLAVVTGAQSRTAEGEPLVVIEATVRPEHVAAARPMINPNESNGRDGPSIRKGRRGIHPPPLPARVRLVADARTSELVSAVAEWPDGSRFLRRIVLERVAPRATDEGWFSAERHVPAAAIPRGG